MLYTQVGSSNSLRAGGGIGRRGRFKTCFYCGFETHSAHYMWRNKCHDLTRNLGNGLANVGRSIINVLFGSGTGNNAMTLTLTRTGKRHRSRETGEHAAGGPCPLAMVTTHGCMKITLRCRENSPIFLTWRIPDENVCTQPYRFE